MAAPHKAFKSLKADLKQLKYINLWKTLKKVFINRVLYSLHIHTVYISPSKTYSVDQL